MLGLIKSLCFIACLSPAAALSERHVASEMPTAMTQVNLCYLNEGKTMEDVDTFNKTFFDWTRAEDSRGEVNDSECQTPIRGGKTYWNR